VALAAACASPAFARSDVNRDGRLDDQDVKALARMVSGLDPADPSCDQNGDGRLTLDDVDALLAEIQAREATAKSGPELGFGGSRGPGTAAGGPGATESEATGADADTSVRTTGGGLSFFAIRQKATGDCVVVAGEEGISPGDTVYGAYPAFQPAQDALAAECVSGGADTAADTGLSMAPDGSGRSLLASPILAAPKFDNDESTEGIFFVSLETGNAFFIDRVKGSPLSVRTRTLNQNVFQALGRPPGDSARHGDILIGSIRKKSGQMHALLLLDTTSGAMAYITDLDDRSYEGRLRPIRGRPAERLAGDDGNFALVMWEARSGRTDGAFFVNGTTGDCLFFEGVGTLETNLIARTAPTLPVMPGGVSAMPIHADDESTSHMLLMDNRLGTLYYAELPRKRPWDFAVSTLHRNLYVGLPREATVETPHRLVPVPITSSSGETDAAIIVDVGSGRMVVLKNLLEPSRVLLVGVDRTIYEKLPAEVARPRVITAVSKVDSSGATRGAWLFDSVTGSIVYLESLHNLRSLEIRTVEERAR
jgi:hypothetical protein